MSRARAENSIRKILDNILFLEEVFGDQADGDIPRLPVLEMARCFDLEPPRNVHVTSAPEQSVAAMEINPCEASSALSRSA